MSEETKIETASAPDGNGKNAYYMQKRNPNRHHHKQNGERSEEKTAQNNGNGNNNGNPKNRPAPTENNGGNNGENVNGGNPRNHHHRHHGHGGGGNNGQNPQNQNQNQPKKENAPAKQNENQQKNGQGNNNQKKNPHNDRGQNRRPERKSAPIEQDVYGDPKHDKEMAELRARIVLNTTAEVAEPITPVAPYSNTNTVTKAKDSPEKIEEERNMDVSHILNEIPSEERKTVEVVGVQFRSVGKIYYFAPGELKVKIGDKVIVETARGPEYGTIAEANTNLPVSDSMPPLKNVLRLATNEDNTHQEELLLKEKEALRIFRERIVAHDLPMSPFDVRYAFDGSQILFYFSAENRVDFRDLVRDLASVFHTRIELRQIGAKDEAKMLGGIGACGRLLCCTSFLGSFVTTGIRMAKDQGLAYSSKLNGYCGRPMCCLAFENQLYIEASKKCPSVGDIVTTPDGAGKVVTVSPLNEIITVAIQKEETTLRQNYNLSDLKMNTAEKKEETAPVSPAETEEKPEKTETEKN